MKGRLLLVLCLLTALPLALPAQSQLFNLTPRPVSLVRSTGSLALPQAFTVGTQGLPADMAAEADRFATAIMAATDLKVTVDAAATDPFIAVVQDNSLADEGYTARITDTGISLSAKTATGLYYAFQSIKKVLPANVMAGVRDPRVTAYELPIAHIKDNPRFGYRGFMLDVARHFFTVDEVKRMLDVMSYYKLNRFHWHLSDDQGWRVEIKKYPRLTTVGATAPNSRFTSMTEGQYWINRPYGPYFYTQDQIREVVAYAKERHIEIIPEIDMPGHFCAALAAYPEYSCTPNGSHTVQTDGGIYSDVLNVGDPAAVQFAKDVLAELIDLFPYEYINIGGDECPVTAWQGNALCQARYKELGLTNYRQLQSHFIKEMGDFVASKGRKIAVWNEGITAGGADTKLVQETGALVYCWTGAAAAAQKAAQLGLPNIYTPWGPYYINRKQSSAPTEPAGAGDGTDDVRKTYNEGIPDATDAGVQGTFWTEHVSDREYMEYLALPRLIAIAEAGWTPQNKRDFEDFRKRMSADTVLLNYGGYRYCKYHMLDAGTAAVDTVLPKLSTATDRHWYRIVSGATDATRTDRCIELLSATSPLVGEYAAKGAAANVLWTNTQAAENAGNYDAQWWAIEEDPANPGHYALVCKAAPDGSVNPTPTANTNAGRWKYDTDKKNYAFRLGANGYGKKGNNYYYSISSDLLAGKFLNSSLGGQGLAVNVYDKPNDGNSGYWEWQPNEPEGSATVHFKHLKNGAAYRFTCAVDGFDATAIADAGTGTVLRHSTDAFAHDAWVVSDSTANADGTQTFKLRNAATGRYIAATSAFAARTGRVVNVGATGASVSLTTDASHNTEYRLSVGGASLFPIPSGTVSAGSTTSATADAPRLQGATWHIAQVVPATLICKDEAGDSITTFVRSLDPETTTLTAELCPTIKGYSFVKAEATSADTYVVTYKRESYAIVIEGRDRYGAIVVREETTASVGETYTVKLPAPKYYTLGDNTVKDGDTFVPTTDSLLSIVYETDAITGVKAPADAVTAVSAGRRYLLYDAASGDAASRAGYRCIVPDTKNVNRFIDADKLDATAVWTLEASGTGYRIKNDYLGLYIPQLQRSAATTAASAGGLFTFTLNADGETWNIKGDNGQYWDGEPNGNLVGWDGGTGHPIKTYEFFAEPCYTVTLTCQDEEGTVLSTTTTLLPAGTAHEIVFPEIPDHAFKSATGNESYEGTVEGFVHVVATYASVVDGINGVVTGASDAASGLYDLQGRRLKVAPTSGVYISNGKKIIVR